MEHLKYCLKEILITKSIIELENSNFYKRNLCRYISIRVDDFIKLSFELNKKTINKQLIKDDLNALQECYKEFFKIQRDKFGAHFQELDFSKRLEFWAQIDYEKADFFSSMPAEIYKTFNEVSGFQDANQLYIGLSNDLKLSIEEKNKELDIEKFPSFSSDILSLTRYNTGGIIPCSMLQVKAGVLKSLEIILDYNFELFRLTRSSIEVSNIFKKILITDLVSYCDNFITRTDLPVGAKQEEDGLDKYITESDFPTAHRIINSFLINYKFKENVDLIRTIRNKSCGHIDNSISISDQLNDLNSIDIDVINSIYSQIRKTYRQICKEEFVFGTFLLEPKDRIYGVQQFVGLPVQPFEKGNIPKTEFKSLDINDINEYDSYFNLLTSKENHEEARHFFWECFCSSDIIERKTITTENKHFARNDSFDYRKSHEYFSVLLLNDTFPLQDKSRIIQLFIESKSGYPNTLLYILLESYNKNKIYKSLNTAYLYAFGELCSERDETTFNILNENLNTDDFYIFYNSLLSIYKIDIKARQHLTIDIDTKESVYSKLVKRMILDSKDDFIRISLSLSLTSELIYSTSLNHFKKHLSSLYLTFFERQFKIAISKICEPLIKNDVDKRKYKHIIASFNNRRFSTLIGLFGDFLKKKKHYKESEKYRSLLYEGVVKYAHNDYNELHNFGVICFQKDNIELAVKVAEYLRDNYPNNIQSYFFLLSLYMNSDAHANHYNKTKNYVLNNFNLSNEQKKQFDLLEFKKNTP